ncbi:MAG TPA: hypothetical protein VKB59_03910 [Micromonosporaceae bacterium]|nr:hypothetical protein [Micromonosporaceae bacterium]
MTKLDDLGRREPKRGRPTGRMVRSVLFCVAISGFVWEFMRTKGVAVPYVLLLTLSLAGAAMIELIRRLSPPRVPDALRDTQEPAPPNVIPDADGMFRAVRRWSQRLEWSRDDLHRFGNRVQPAVVEIVEDRLWLRHGVSRAADPDRARELCGPVLWDFLTAPVTRPVTRTELATLVAAMEAL